MQITYHPIGVYHTGLSPATGAPRQGILDPGNTGRIEVFDEYTDGLRGLDRHQYIIVLYHMHLSDGWHTDVRPPGSSQTFGLFATRTPNRPNPLAFAVIRLDSINGPELYVSGVDAFDGTPVLDIKPWIPSIDCPGTDSN